MGVAATIAPMREHSLTFLRAWVHLAKPEKLGVEEGTGGVQDSMGARALAWRKSFKDVQCLEVEINPEVDDKTTLL